MRCENCSYYKPTESICIKIREGKLSCMDTDCLLRYMINQLGDIIDMLLEDEDEWKS